MSGHVFLLIVSSADGTLKHAQQLGHNQNTNEKGFEGKRKTERCLDRKSAGSLSKMFLLFSIIDVLPTVRSCISLYPYVALLLLNFN